MADSRAVESGREATGSQTQDAGNAALARGAAGSETGAQAEAPGDRHRDLEERRETEQVQRSTSDGMGDGLVKDQG
jgi:hypothetical protein